MCVSFQCSKPDMAAFGYEHVQDFRKSHAINKNIPETCVKKV